MGYQEGVCIVGFTPDFSKVLLTRRRDVPIWYLPVGGIEPGEIPQNTAIREFKEETGLDITLLRYHGLYEVRVGSFYKDGNHLYSGVISGDVMTPNPEINNLRYFDLSQIPIGLPRFHKDRILDAKENRAYDDVVIQRIGVFDMITLFLRNPQTIWKVPSIIRRIARNDPKK